MKTVFLCFPMILSLISFGQKNDTRIVLDKGQKFTVHTTSTQEADMGMGMEMKNNTSSQNNFYVIAVNDKNYTVSNTLTGLKISMDFMGQQTNYDSDLKEDSASEIGKSIQNLNIPDTISINSYTAELISSKKTADAPGEQESNPMEGLFESLGDKGADMALSDAFLIIPQGKKAGDSWSDSSSTKEQKTHRNFTIKSIEKNIATLIIIGNVESNIQTESNGMQLTVSMTTKNNSEVLTDIKTSLVMKRDTKSDITGTIEVMGQSAPITGKATTISVYEY